MYNQWHKVPYSIIVFKAENLTEKNFESFLISKSKYFGFLNWEIYVTKLNMKIAMWLFSNKTKY